MQNTSSTRRRKRPQGSSEEFSPVRDDNNNENSPLASLFFASGERRLDLDRPSTSECMKRMRVDAPVFYERGLNDGIQACEPAAGEALIGLATGKLLYYGEYYEQNKLLRELAFEREARQQFGNRSHRSSSNNDFHVRFAYGGHDDDDDDL